ncbi:MAG: hypothetical protein IKA96_07525 [Alistipes sp.]|nr:hypothetical protein [Alistipes sp.]MBR7097425.1 hypothetical protein [Alistipes sp.]
MRRFIYIISIVCLAMMFASCVKEESHSMTDVSLMVNLSRAGSTSEQQGDQIEEAMVWAFQINGAQISDNAAGWRRATFSNTYTNVSVHVDLPQCGDGGADYLLVAVVNPAKFGAITNPDGTPLTLDGATTYPQLINARFANVAGGSTPILGSVAEGTPGEPALMPISHWENVSVTSADLHSATPHKLVDMSVFRAVAKTQFLIAKTSAFDLKVTALTLHSGKMPQNGLLLSSLSKEQLLTVNTSPAWFNNNTPTYASATSAHAFAIADGGKAVDKILAAATQNVVDYTLAGACTVAETSEACTFVDNAKSAPAGNGYYYEIKYQVGAGAEQTRYVALPAIARNHDYQVRALVNGEGGIEVSYTVKDWEDVSWDLTGSFTPAINTNLLAAPDVNSTATVAPKVRYDATNPTPFKGYLRMSAPIDATWKPVLFSAENDEYRIEVFKVTSKNPVTVEATPVYSDAAQSTMTPITVAAENKDTFYEVRVTPLKQNPTDSKFKLAISHNSLWHTDYKLLLINMGATSTSTYWPDSGNNHTYIEITQE